MTTRSRGYAPRRAVAVALTAALAVGAIGAPAAVAQDDAGDALEIAFIQTGPYPYYERGVEGAKMAADALGVELSVLNSDLSAEQEIANVEDAITKGVDGIVLFSVGRASEEAALTKANEAGIPVAVLYGYAPELEDMGAVFVQADINQTGAMAGEWLAANVPSGKVAIIQGALGRGDAEAYTASFKEALAANPDLEIVGEPAGDWARDSGSRCDAGPADGPPGPGRRVRSERRHGARCDPGHQGRRCAGRPSCPRTVPRTASVPSRPVRSPRPSAGRPPRRPRWRWRVWWPPSTTAPSLIRSSATRR